MIKIISFLFCVLLLAACAAHPSPTPPPASPLPTTAPLASPTPAPDLNTVCLQGNWRFNQSDSSNLLANITSIPSLVVQSGALYISFADGLFAYHSDDLDLRTSFLEGFLDARANVLIEGDYTIEDTTLHFTKTNAKNELYDWRAVSGASVQPFTGTSPVFDFAIADQATFVCADDLLTLTFNVAGFEGASFELTREK